LKQVTTKPLLISIVPVTRGRDLGLIPRRGDAELFLPSTSQQYNFSIQLDKINIRIPLGNSTFQDLRG